MSKSLIAKLIENAEHGFFNGRDYLKAAERIEELEVKNKELLVKIGELDLKIQSAALDHHGFGDSDYND